MAIKDILIYLDNDTDCEKRIRSMAQLGKKLGAHLAGLYIARMIHVHPYPYAYLPEAAFETMAANADKKREAVETQFNDLCSAEGIGGEFRAIKKELSIGLSIHSRYADLLVVPGRPIKDSMLNPDFQLIDILPVSACPVLVLPEGSDSFNQLPKKVMLAWNGSHESARALSLAMPMLDEVECLDIVSVSEDEAEAADIARHLARHGVNVNVHLVEGSSSNAGSTLLNQAEALETELIIMGAYSHSRFREQLLGGTTKYMTEHTTLPILYSH